MGVIDQSRGVWVLFLKSELKKTLACNPANVITSITAPRPAEKNPEVSTAEDESSARPLNVHAAATGKVNGCSDHPAVVGRVE